jgi:hypothetical protein
MLEGGIVLQCINAENWKMALPFPPYVSIVRVFSLAGKKRKNGSFRQELDIFCQRPP